MCTKLTQQKHASIQYGYGHQNNASWMWPDHWPICMAYLLAPSEGMPCRGCILSMLVGLLSVCTATGSGMPHCQCVACLIICSLMLSWPSVATVDTTSQLTSCPLQTTYTLQLYMQLPAVHTTAAVPSCHSHLSGHTRLAMGLIASFQFPLPHLVPLCFWTPYMYDWRLLPVH